MAEKGFTKTGQPIIGRRYLLQQGDMSTTVTVVGKLFGQGGNSDLVGIVIEDDQLARIQCAWPLSGPGDVRFEAAPKGDAP